MSAMVAPGLAKEEGFVFAVAAAVAVAVAVAEVVWG